MLIGTRAASKCNDRAGHNVYVDIRMSRAFCPVSIECARRKYVILLTWHGARV